MSKTIAALDQIRLTTTYLWPKLTELTAENSAFACQIRESTYRKVASALEILSSEGQIRYSTAPAYHNKEEWILRLHITALSPRLGLMAREISGGVVVATRPS